MSRGQAWSGWPRPGSPLATLMQMELPGMSQKAVSVSSTTLEEATSFQDYLRRLKSADRQRAVASPVPSRASEEPGAKERAKEQSRGGIRLDEFRLTPKEVTHTTHRLLPHISASASAMAWL